jgi:hypothetical protein
MTDAYDVGSALEAEATLLALAKELDRTHPGLTCKGVHIVDSTDSGMQDLLVTPTPIPNLQEAADLLAPQELHYLW